MGVWACQLQLVLFLLILINNIVFRHSHCVHGTIISHAHPYKADHDGPIQHHHHSQYDFTLLDAISNGVFLGSVVFAIMCVAATWPVLYQQTGQVATIINFFNPANRFRGPPAC